jgi:hypothetical protein
MVGVGWFRGLRWLEPKRAMWSLRVVVLDVDTQHAFEVAAVEDQQPVEALAADGSDETLGDGVCLRRSHRRLSRSGCQQCGTPRRRAAVLAVAVADQEPHALVRELEAEVACLLGDPGAGGVRRAAGQPDAPARVRDEEQGVVAAQEHTLKVKKSQATMLAAWVRRNSRQPGPDLRGAGPSPARASSRRTVDGDTRKPSLASSPLIRRWPQRGFSRARRSTRTRTSVGMGGRPRRPGGCRHFRHTSARCQRNNVRGVTRSRPREERGSWHAAAASRARSAARSFGRATWRRRTSSSWRRTSSSMSLTSRPRRLRTTAPRRALNAR